MICNGDDLHDWTIARRNLIYCLTEIVCANCGLVYELQSPNGNGYSRPLKEELETPGYRARNWRKSLQRSREHPEWVKRNQNESRIPVVI